MERLTIRQLLASSMCGGDTYNTYQLSVLAHKAKAALWLVECIQQGGADVVKNHFMLGEYEEICKLCIEANEIDISSGHGHSEFVVEFLGACVEYKEVLKAKGLTEKQKKRQRLLEELKALDD